MTCPKEGMSERNSNSSGNPDRQASVCPSAELTGGHGNPEWRELCGVASVLPQVQEPSDAGRDQPQSAEVLALDRPLGKDSEERENEIEQGADEAG